MTSPSRPPAWQTHRPGRHGFPAKTARRIIRRDKECQLAYPGCTGTPTAADHIVGWADATAAGWEPEDIDDPTNGQGVCGPCHTIKTQGEARRGAQRAAARRPRNRPRSNNRHPGFRK